MSMTLDGSTLPSIVADEDLFLFFPSEVTKKYVVVNLVTQALERADRKDQFSSELRRRPVKPVTPTGQTGWM